MLAMWHRVVTRRCAFACPESGQFKFGEAEAKQIAAAALRAKCHLVADDVAQYVANLEDAGSVPEELKKIGVCRPIADLAWVEYSDSEFSIAGDNQIGLAFAVISDTEVNVAVFQSIRGEPICVAPMVRCMFLETGECKEIVTLTSASGQAQAFNAGNIGPMILRGLYAFAFAHCKNVEQVDCTTKHGPNQKVIRRKKWPSVIFKTLNIPGVTKRYEKGESENDDAGRRAHICRGHFATYTDESKLFGKYVGKFWHPAHVRGNAKNGSVVKDYEIAPIGV